MSLVSAKCPNCGASIQLDNECSEAFCLYCGSKVKVQQAINVIRIDRAGDLQNYLTLTQTSIDSNNGVEALSYANAALEIDAFCAQAWLLKMYAQRLLWTLDGFNYNEIVVCGSKAIECSESEDIKITVYSFYLKMCSECLTFCKNCLYDTNDIELLYKTNYSLNPFTAPDATLAADGILNMVVAAEPAILSLRFAVPNEEIPQNEALQKLVSDITAYYKYYQRAMNSRLKVYGTNMSDSYLNRCKKIYAKLSKGFQI